MNEDIRKLIADSFTGLGYKPGRTYVVYLPPLAKALLEETNRKYQFYEFIISNTSALTHSINPKDKKHIYVKVPLWLYVLAKQQGFNSVGIYLLSVSWMSFFGAKFEPRVPSVSIKVYRFLYRAFGVPLFPELYRPMIESVLDNRLYYKPHKTYEYNHRVAKRLRYVKKRYGLTRTNTMLLFLAFFLKYMKDFMVRR